MLFEFPFLKPHLITYRSNVGVQLRLVIGLGVSTLTNTLVEQNWVPNGYG